MSLRDTYIYGSDVLAEDAGEGEPEGEEGEEQQPEEGEGYYGEGVYDAGYGEGPPLPDDFAQEDAAAQAEGSPSEGGGGGGGGGGEGEEGPPSSSSPGGGSAPSDAALSQLANQAESAAISAQQFISSVVAPQQHPQVLGDELDFDDSYSGAFNAEILGAPTPAGDAVAKRAIAAGNRAIAAAKKSKSAQAKRTMTSGKKALALGQKLARMPVQKPKADGKPSSKPVNKPAKKPASTSGRAAPPITPATPRTREMTSQSVAPASNKIPSLNSVANLLSVAPSSLMQAKAPPISKAGAPTLMQVKAPTVVKQVAAPIVKQVAPPVLKKAVAPPIVKKVAAPPLKKMATPLRMTRVRGDESKLLQSPLAGISDEGWTEYVFAIKGDRSLDTVEPNGLGMFGLSPRRLEDLGLVMRLTKTRLPSGKLGWACEFVPPLTREAFLSSSRLQYKAFCASMRDYVERLRSGAIPRPTGWQNDQATLSGVLAILQKAGPAGLESWFRGDRFDSTVELFDAANGAF